MVARNAHVERFLQSFMRRRLTAGPAARAFRQRRLICHAGFRHMVPGLTRGPMVLRLMSMNPNRYEVGEPELLRMVLVKYPI